MSKEKKSLNYMFLLKCKKLLSTCELQFIERSKNINSLTKHGLLVSDVKKCLLELRPSDYCSGPEKDRDANGDIWVYKKIINGTQFYIKLKIVYENNKEELKCISFHEDE